jgi:hypothetical protein
MVGVYAKADNLPAHTAVRVRFTLECGFIRPHPATARFTTGIQSSWGYRDFFGVGAMSGGFDAAAWAAKGLPTEGQPLVFKLKVRPAA